LIQIEWWWGEGGRLAAVFCGLPSMAATPSGRRCATPKIALAIFCGVPFMAVTRRDVKNFSRKFSWVRYSLMSDLPR
jgi:hypothetical protein